MKLIDADNLTETFIVISVLLRYSILLFLEINSFININLDVALLMPAKAPTSMRTSKHILTLLTRKPAFVKF